MSLRYSPLCDTDQRAYLAYLFANYGSGIERSSGFRGAGGGSRLCGRGVDHGSDSRAVVSSDYSAWQARMVSIFGSVASGRATEYFDCSVCASAVGSVEGISDSHDCGGSRDDSGCDGRDGGSGGGRSDTATTGGLQDGQHGLLGSDVSGETCVDGSETDYERMKRLRKEKRSRHRANRAARKLEGVPEWRVLAAPLKTSVDQSLFRDCSDDVKRELKESRARMYIARNRAEEEKSLALEKKLRMERETHVDEREFEVRRQKVEKTLKKEVLERYGDISVGFAKTIVDEGLSEVSSVPSLDKGSVSAESSVSVDVVTRLICKNEKLGDALSEMEKKVEALQKTLVLSNRTPNFFEPASVYDGVCPSTVEGYEEPDY